ncbi:UPF0160 protein MYG1 [Harpegnathos saltator]|uniref:UPF0160 protein MYG1 n=2 Tax=Harpegnathos saltator TaxID=610380 RepID=E2C2I3_HARSA|nr:UPF0160 protein MYG1 [Harpegnathos saltator]
MDKEIKIGTHNGTFHCDEVFACVLLKLLPQYKDAIIVRSRDKNILDKCDIVVDVGGVYDHYIRRYDHHMRDFCETAKSVLKKSNYNNKVKLSSAGLVYCHFGHEILRNLCPDIQEDKTIEKFFKRIYDTLIVEVDAIDNGQNESDCQPLYRINTDLSSRVKNLNPFWNSNMDEEEQFKKAMTLVHSVFMDSVSYTEKVWLPAEQIVYNAVNRRFEVDSSGEIIELSQRVPWQSYLFHMEREMNISPPIKYIIFFSSDNDHRIQCVPISAGQFKCRLPFPKKWCGLRNDALVKACQIEGADFVHVNGFIGGHATRDGAVAMAQKSLKISKTKSA